MTNNKFTYNQIVHLNAYIFDNGLHYKAYMKNYYEVVVEPLGICACIGKDEDIKKVIEDYFKSQNIEIIFQADNLVFHLKQNSGKSSREIEKQMLQNQMQQNESQRKTIQVSAAIIIDGDKIFATQRGYGEFKNWWEFPGGKLELGETPEQALIREIEEELNTEIEIKQLVEKIEYDYPKFHLTMYCFLCNVIIGDLILKEHKSAKWLTKETLDTVKWLPADEGIVKKLKDLI